MLNHRTWLAVLLAGMMSFAAMAQDKVPYHIDEAATQATKGLRNIRNHLDVAPDKRISVVTHANGVDFLLEGARDPKDPNVDYGSLVSALKARGVTFEVCEITLRTPLTAPAAAPTTKRQAAAITPGHCALW